MHNLTSAGSTRGTGETWLQCEQQAEDQVGQGQTVMLVEGCNDVVHVVQMVVQQLPGGFQIPHLALLVLAGEAVGQQDGGEGGAAEGQTAPRHPPQQVRRLLDATVQVHAEEGRRHRAHHRREAGYGDHQVQLQRAVARVVQRHVPHLAHGVNIFLQFPQLAIHGLPLPLIRLQQPRTPVHGRRLLHAPPIPHLRQHRAAVLFRRGAVRQT
mmetsp:Transcript_3431/g.9927  ORF Transcript_3431/g.9927 Transcript_3431/m.9927 type:complete len:211 (-) Transcript_3431:1562-2194(-)